MGAMAWFLLLISIVLGKFTYAQTEPNPLLISLSKNTFLSTLIAKPLIESRCDAYQGNTLLQDIVEGIFDPIISYKCEKVADQLFKVLNIKTLADADGYIGRAIFANKLIELLIQPETESILNAILTNYSTASKTKPFNLTNILTQAPFYLSKQASIEFIAVLFQDTNSLQHIYYLNLLKALENWSDWSQKSKNLELLTNANTFFQGNFYDFQSFDKNIDSKNFIFFPQDSKIAALDRADFQPALYHFYVPAYLSQKLSTLKNTTYYAFIAPFALRVIYEQIFNYDTDLSKLDTYLIALGNKESAVTSKYKQIDLYLSLMGGYWALNVTSQLTFEDFAAMSKRNMSNALRLVTKNL